MRRRLTYSAVFVVHLAIAANPAEAEPRDPTKWAEQVFATWKDDESQRIRRPRFLAVARLRKRAKPQLWDLKPAEINKLSFLEAADLSSIQITLAINRMPKKILRKGRATPGIVRLLANGSDVDFVMELGLPPAKWRIYYLEEGRSRLRAEGKGNNMPTPANIVAWAAKKMRLDGVVLAVEDKYVLVWSIAEKLKQDRIQALVTDQKMGDDFKKERGKGLQLLELVSANGSVGVFKTLLTDQKQNQIEPGQRVILQE